MAPDSKPPLTHQRPPLATRLRKSFESKRSKSEVTSPTFNSYAVQDPEALQTAVDQAINSEAFQNAIAANLARLIKPSITTALDTIQPIVEAVYSHDVLLRRTNKSVEDILERMDTLPEEPSSERRTHSPPSPHTPHSTRERSGSAGSFHDLEFRAVIEKSNKRTVATLAELSNAVSGNNSKISGMEKSLVETKESVEYLKAYLHNQLDQVQADMGRIVDTREANRKSREINGRDDSLFSSHITKLDAISTDIAGLKGFSTTSKKLDSISAELNALRASFDASTSANDGNFSELGSKFTHFSTAFDAHGAALRDIKESDKNSDIMAALQRSNASHESHASVLNEMKERSLLEPSTARGSAARDDSESTAVLQELRPDLASIKEEIKTELKLNNDSVADLHAKVESVLTTFERHREAFPSTEMLESVQKSNDSHTSHTAALDEIKSLIVVPASSSHSDTLKSIESQVGSIIATLDLHGISLADLKTVHQPSTELVRAESGSEPLSSPTLESHTLLLNEIKDNISAEILTALHEIGQTQASHTASLSEIREADVSDEILTALHTSIEAHTAHESAFNRLHEAIQDSNDMHEKHNVSLGALSSKSLKPDSAPVSESTGLGDLETRLGGIHSTLEEQSTVLAALKDSTNSSIEYHKGHIASLNEIKDVTASSKDLHESHGNALSEIRAATLASKDGYSAHTATLADLVIATGASNESHASHTAALSELKSLDSTKSNTSNEDVLSRISSLQSAIDETKAGVDAHTSLTKDLHSETKESHSSIATTLSALAVGGAVGGGAGMIASRGRDDDDNNTKELLSEVKAVKDIVEKSSLSTKATEQSVSSMANQIGINHTTVTTTISTLSDELKAEVDASGTEVVDFLAKFERGFNEMNTAVGGINGRVGVLAGGVQLSEVGLKQLSAIGPVGSVKEVGEHDLTTVAKTPKEAEIAVAPVFEPKAEGVESHQKEEEKESPADSAALPDRKPETISAAKDGEAVKGLEKTVEHSVDLSKGPGREEEATASPSEPANTNKEEGPHPSKLELDSEEQIPTGTKLDEKPHSAAKAVVDPDSSDHRDTQEATPEHVGEQPTKVAEESEGKPIPIPNEDAQVAPLSPLTPTEDLVSDVIAPDLKSDEAPAPESRPSTAPGEGLKSPTLPEATDEEDTEPPSTLTSPVSPGFNDDGEGWSSKKGKKGKNGKNGNKKAKPKKEKVPFVMDGDEPEE